MPETAFQPELIVSDMAENLIGSEIIKLAAEVNEMIRRGEKVYNLTIGDFDPKKFPIPAELNEAIISAYKDNQTNYPAANGISELRNAVREFLIEREGLHYDSEEILIAGGARPIIYAAYRTLIDPQDTVIFPVPSWNNNHYCHLTDANAIFVETKPENNFMPTADELRPYVKDATLIALCSPLNPTGTTFTKEGLEDICDLVLEENARRTGNEKPLYLLYDQIYWILTFGNIKHYNPVSLRPDMRNYTIFIDGISKAFAATGVRVGWGFGPRRIIDKMKAILTHVGAWAPKAEQVASAKYLKQKENVDAYLKQYKDKINSRLVAFYNGIMKLNKIGYDIYAIAPQAAIYLTVQINLKGKKTAKGTTLQSTEDTTSYILNEAKIALVPFYAFGTSPNSTWYRLSVGTCSMEEIDLALDNLKKALQKLS
jgi:aspartate aminotransferase